MPQISPAKISANIANAQLSTGPRTAEGKSTSAKNALKSGLFSKNDFIRPGEEHLYSELDQSLQIELAPSGHLEHHLVDEIRRAMWRLRRCGDIEATLVRTCAEAVANDPASPIPDPMQYEPTAKLQLSVDRARAQCHRILNKCAADLRKLQAERQPLNEVGQYPPPESEFTKQTQPSRNSRCACGSGQKYKRCCGRGAAPLLTLPRAA